MWYLIERFRKIYSYYSVPETNLLTMSTYYSVPETNLLTMSTYYSVPETNLLTMSTYYSVSEPIFYHYYSILKKKFCWLQRQSRKYWTIRVGDCMHSKNSEFAGAQPRIIFAPSNMLSIYYFPDHVVLINFTGFNVSGDIIGKWDGISK